MLVDLIKDEFLLRECLLKCLLQQVFLVALLLTVVPVFLVQIVKQICLGLFLQVPITLLSFEEEHSVEVARSLMHAGNGLVSGRAVCLGEALWRCLLVQGGETLSEAAFALICEASIVEEVVALQACWRESLGPSFLLNDSGLPILLRQDVVITATVVEADVRWQLVTLQFRGVASRLLESAAHDASSQV